MHDTETGRDYTPPTDNGSGEKHDDCPHPSVRRIGRVRGGAATVDLDCANCGETVHEDVRGRNGGVGA